MEVTRALLTVRIQSREEAERAAAAIEAQGEHFSNVTYTHPTDDGGVAIETEEDAKAAVQALAQQVLANQVPRVGRNDPCPCGSGKKYKQCHGQLA